MHRVEQTRFWLTTTTTFVQGASPGNRWLLILDRDTRRWRQAEDEVGMELELRAVLGEEESICEHLPVSDIEGFERL